MLERHRVDGAGLQPRVRNRADVVLGGEGLEDGDGERNRVTSFGHHFLRESEDFGVIYVLIVRILLGHLVSVLMNISVSDKQKKLRSRQFKLRLK